MIFKNNFIKEFDNNVNNNTSDIILKEKMDEIIINIKTKMNKLSMNITFSSKYDIEFNIPPPEPNKLLAIKAKDKSFIYIIFNRNEKKYIGYKIDLNFNNCSILENINIYGLIDPTCKYFYIFNYNAMFIINKV